MPRKLSFETELQIVQEYINGIGSTILGKKYNVNHTTILNIVRHHDIKIRENTCFKNVDQSYKRLYRYNDDYFKNINSKEKAYWLGFISADGCIIDYSYEPILRLAIKTSDAKHLEKFLNCIESNVTIHTYSTTSGYKYSRISISSESICNDLIVLGVVPRKTYILKPPIIDNKFQSDYIRGYLDGDGCITHSHINSNGKKDYAVKIVGTNDILLYIKNFIEENRIAKIHKFYKRHEGDIVSQLELPGNYQVKKFLDLIYNDSDVYLDRKYQLYKEICNQFNSN